MNNQHSEKRRICKLFLMGAILGIIIFLIIFGVRILDPTYDDWILVDKDDLTQHYFGWKFLRKSSWHFPLGTIDNISSSGGVSCIFFDCVPLFAIFFKLLSPLLPETFQYIGIWELFCFAMMGGSSAVLLHRFSRNNFFCLCGSIVFIISPTVMQRTIHHEALSAQWIIVLAIILWVYQEHEWRNKAMPALLWSVLGIIAVMVHLYFVPMIYAVMLGYIMTDILKTTKIKHSVLCFTSTTMCVLLAMFSFGVFYGKGDMKATGLGKYSSNYNALINPMGYSKFLKPLNYFKGQRGGMGYLGLGMITAGLISLIILIYLANKYTHSHTNFRKSVIEKAKIVIPVLIVLAVAMFAAASPVGTLNRRIIYTIEYPEKIENILKIFRASGRFIWIDLYLIYTIIFALLSKIRRSDIAIALAVVCTTVQIFDLSDFILSKHRTYVEYVKYENDISKECFEEAAENADRIVCLPITKNYLHYKKLFFSLGEYACDEDMKMNVFYTARQDYKTLKQFADEEYQNLINGNGDTETLYVFLDEKYIPDDSDNLQLYKLGTYTAVRVN